jgi:hypothetical protein
MRKGICGQKFCAQIAVRYFLNPRGSSAIRGSDGCQWKSDASSFRWGIYVSSLAGGAAADLTSVVPCLSGANEIEDFRPVPWLFEGEMCAQISSLILIAHGE